jgi:hypothetical protein
MVTGGRFSGWTALMLAMLPTDGLHFVRIDVSPPHVLN